MKFWEMVNMLEHGTGKVQGKDTTTGETFVICDLFTLVECIDHTYYSGDITWSVYKEPKPKKQVWQWRYNGTDRQGTYPWMVSEYLLTEEEAKSWFADTPHKKHAGPFEVEE